MDNALITRRLYKNVKVHEIPIDDADDLKNLQYKEYKINDIKRKNLQKLALKKDKNNYSKIEEEEEYDDNSDDNDDDLDDDMAKLGYDMSNIRLVPINRKVFIDSYFRDKYVYPDASEFVVSWGRAFTNVSSIKLSSLEFPNVVPTFNNSNNTLYWINKEDIDLPEPYPIYTTTMDIGSYTLSSLETHLAEIMKAPKRHYGIPNYVTGEKALNHYLMVTLNNDSDKVSFTSIVTKNAPISPIKTIEGSNVIYVNQPDHGYENAETIYIIGVMGIIGGIPAADINVSSGFQITKEDDNTFSFEIATHATSTITGGGSQVKIGRGAPFQFLFGSYNNTPANELGFPVENSSESLPFENPITSTIKEIQGMEIDPTNDGYLSVTCQDHELEIGDEVYIYNLRASPDIYNDTKHKGVFTVINIFTQDRILLDCKLSDITSWEGAFLGTRIFKMFFPGHGFNRITEIKQVAIDTVQISTLFDHGFGMQNNKNLTRISGSNCIPSVDGVYYANYINRDTFTVTVPGIDLSQDGYSGILTTSHDFFLYNVQPFGGFTYNELNGKQFSVRNILNEYEFVFVGKYGFSSKIETGGGSAIRINSKLHGWNGTQTNFIDNKLYRPLRLSGDDYVFMCIPNLKSDSVSSNCLVDHIFAKIYITANPGQVIFHEFDASPVEFNTPIKKVDELKIQIKSKHNELISFNGLDFSFSFEITELIRRDRTVEYSRNANGYAGLM